MDTPALCLTSVAILSCTGRFHHLFLVFLTLKTSQNHVAEAAKFCCLLGLQCGPFLQIHFQQLASLDDFLHHLSLAVLELVVYTMLALKSEFCLHLPLQCCD